MNWRKILFLLGVIIALCTPVLYAQEEPEAEVESGLGLSAGVDYWSTYFWRGTEFYGRGESAIFPWISYSLADTGLSFTACGEHPMEMLGDGVNKTLDGYNGIDLGAAYSYSIENVVTFGANGWFYWYYVSKDKLGYNANYFSLIGSVTLDMVPILTPAISYTHDFYVSKDATANEKRFNDFYIQLSLNQSFELSKESAIELKLFGSFFNYKSQDTENQDRKGISDMGFAVKGTTTAGITTFYCQMNYAFVPHKDFYKTKVEDFNGNTGYIMDKHHWWASVGASVAL